MKSIPLRVTTGAAVAALALNASGCAWFEPEEEDLDFAANEVRLTDMYNESVRLGEELDEAEARIVQDCLEEQGFEAHDPYQFDTSSDEERDTFLGEAPYETFLPSEEEARTRGFWQWTVFDEAEETSDEVLRGAYEDYWLGLGGVAVGEPDPIPEFYLLAPEDQYAWYVAYRGEAWASESYGDLLPGYEPDESEEISTNPPPEGCLLEMIDAVYGGLDEADDTGEGWEWQPAQPTYIGESLGGEYTDRIVGAEVDFLDCLDESGWGGWEFTDGYLAVSEFLYEAGEGEHSVYSYSEAEGSWPDPPSDLPEPDDFQGWVEFERGFAVDVVACGDETGFREAAEHAWQQVELRHYLDIEDDTYAWQEAVRDDIAKAQEVIGG